MQSNTTQYHFPDLAALWPIPYTRNADPCAAEILAKSTDWISSLHAKYAQPSWRAEFERCEFPLMATLVYPFSRGSHLKACVDWCHYIFTFDDYFETLDPGHIEEEARQVLSVLRNPHSPPLANESFLTRLTREFWSMVVESANPPESSVNRFISVYETYLDGVIQEIKDTHNKRIRSIEDHILLRRGTGAVHPTFIFLCLPDDIPDAIMDHPDIKDLTFLALDLVGIANDLHSFNREQSRDQKHNVVQSAMVERGLGVQDAIDHVYQMYYDHVFQFLTKKATVPEFPSPYNFLIKRYLERIQYWIPGYLEWALESARYFDDSNKDSKEMIVELLPVKPLSMEQWFRVEADN